jgi:hypothetical protein
MQGYLIILLTLVIVGLTLVVSSSVTTAVLAQDDPYSEEYMAQHDGGDRAEYLQDMKNGDPYFYVPPVN